jgi:hypothetical protein
MDFFLLFPEVSLKEGKTCLQHVEQRDNFCENILMTRTLADTLKNIYFAKICVHTEIFLKIFVSQSFCIRSARKSRKKCCCLC